MKTLRVWTRIKCAQSVENKVEFDVHRTQAKHAQSVQKKKICAERRKHGRARDAHGALKTRIERGKTRADHNAHEE